jgi:hypothetical protein
MHDSLYAVTDAIKEVAGDDNAPAFKRNFALSESDFNRFWVALDAIEDAHEALQAYPRVLGEDIGTAYLVKFGAMQALSLQQDAVKTLTTVTNAPLKLEDEPSMWPIRTARNWITHQTDPHKKTGHDAVSIIRVSITKDSCQLIRWEAVDEDGKHPVSLTIPEYINKQAEAVLQLLTGLQKFIADGVKKCRKIHEAQAKNSQICPWCDIQMEKLAETLETGGPSFPHLHCWECGLVVLLH